MMIPFLYSYLLFYHKQILEYEWMEDKDCWNAQEGAGN
jgi:hypothetical protein